MTCTICGKQLMQKDWPFLFRAFGSICTDCKTVAAVLISKYGRYQKGDKHE